MLWRRRRKEKKETERRILSKEEVRRHLLSFISENPSGVSWDELYDAVKAKGDVSWHDDLAPGIFQEILRSLEKEGLIRSEFTTPNRIYYPSKKE